MPSYTIYYGAEKPIRAVGKHQTHLLHFAESYPGWHSAASDRATKRAIAGLVRKDCLEVNQFGQFRFKYPTKESAS